MAMAHGVYVASITFVIWPSARSVYAIIWPIVGVAAVIYIAWMERRIKALVRKQGATSETQSWASESLRRVWRPAVIAYGVFAFVSPYAAAIFTKYSNAAN